MFNKLTSYSNASHSGNHVLDVILNRYDTQCKIKNIDFTFDVKIANFNKVDDYDLVTIFGNLLDNALESTEKSENKKICLESSHRNTYDVAIITNSCDVAPDRQLKTTKKDKKTHGLGLKSVSKTLKQYGGDIEWEYDEQSRTYTTIITILNK